MIIGRTMEKRGFKETEIGWIPEDWELKTFSEIVDIIGGGTPKTTIEEYWNGQIPWLSVVDFNNDFRIVNETEKSITELGLNNSSTKILKKGELIISARGTVGAIAQLGRDMAFNQSCYGLRAKNNVTINDFVYYLLKYSLNILKQSTHGSTFDTITINTFDLLKVPFPPFSEQNSIAKILSALDSKIELNHQMNQTLEKIGQAIFKHWFIDFEFPDEDSKPYKSSGGEMVDSELGEIPEGWKVEKIQDFIVFDKGVEPGSKYYETESSENNVRFIRVGDISTPGRYQTYIPLDLYDEKFCNEHDILLSLDATIGVVRIGMKGVHSGGVRRVYSKEKGIIPQGYIYSLLKSKYIQDTIYTYANGTTIMHAGNSLKHMFLAIPQKKIFQKFAEISEPIFNKMVNNIIESNDLEKIRDSLLSKLMSGKIRLRGDAK